MNALLSLLNRPAEKVAYLERIYSQHRTDPTFLHDSVSSLDQLDPECLWHATWLLQRAARDGGVPAETLAHLADQIDASMDWICRLTLCQLFAHAECPRTSRPTLFPFLSRCFEDRRPIVRAWALTALFPFTEEERYRPAVQQMVRLARKDPSPAMQARLRHLPPLKPAARSGAR